MRQPTRQTRAHGEVKREKDGERERKRGKKRGGRGGEGCTAMRQTHHTSNTQIE